MRRKSISAFLLSLVLLLSGCAAEAPVSSPPASSVPSSSAPAHSSAQGSGEEWQARVESESFLSPEHRNALLSEGWLAEELQAEQNCGSAGALVGTVLVVNVFLSDEASVWDDDAKQGVLDTLREGLDFLEQRAADCGVPPVRFVQTDLSDSFDMRFSGVVPEDYNDYRWTDEMLAENGFESFLGLLREAQRKSGGIFDHAAAVVHLNKEGRSYALPAVVNDPADPDWGEHLVMYFDENLSHEYAICPGMYAHELLHLFGAIDLYFPEDPDPSRSDETEELFPDDIMRQVSLDIGESTIDAVTAFRIGWLDTIPDEFLRYVS